MRKIGRKRILAVLTALSMLISETPVYATGDVVVEEATADLVNLVDDAQLSVGSNGVEYDNVVYLTQSTVDKLDTDTQKIYYDICDDIADRAENDAALQDAVIAVDTEGNLYYNFTIPMNTLTLETTESLSDVSLLDETVEITDEKTVDESETITSSEEILEITEEFETETVEISDKDAEETETTVETESEISTTEEETINIEVSTSVDEISTIEIESEAVETETVTEEPSDELKTETITEELKAENLELIIPNEEETFEPIEDIQVSLDIDLGYGKSENKTGQVQINTLAPTDNYFYEQLSTLQKSIYNSAKSKLLNGSNQFGFTATMSSTILEDIEHAVSAIILEYPDKTDWIAKPGAIRGEYVYTKGSSTADYTITLDKSKYYNSTLEKKVQSQVQAVIGEAQQYAIDNYSKSPVYGIVKYLDNWICQNVYYEQVGTLGFGDYDSNGNDKYVEKLKKAGYTYEQINVLLEVYYNCHSIYGAMLNGYAVCESYAKSVSRLLDAIGVPNVYVTGTSSNGGHAWNYVQMPNGNWYMVDTTWNDPTDETKPSTGQYLLVKLDGNHTATGTQYGGEMTAFKFPSVASSNYKIANESLAFNITSCDLQPKETLQLTYTPADYLNRSSKVWTSSNEKVAKVDKNGKVTAVAAGKATITLAVSGMTADCEVRVNQVKSITCADTGKASGTISIGLYKDTNFKADPTEYTLNIDMGNSARSAANLVNGELIDAPKITFSKGDTSDIVSIVQKLVVGNQLDLKVSAKKAGTDTITISFGGKKATIKVNVGTAITGDMFNVDFESLGMVGKLNTVYTGKAIKPKVTKSSTAPKDLKYKVTYLNNVNYGNATVRISGTGKYAGQVDYSFYIRQFTLTSDSSIVDTKAVKAKVYNGGENAPAVKVQSVNGKTKKVLKYGKDYTVLYNGTDYTGKTLPVGKYTISIKGINNYTGTIQTNITYEVKQNTISKLSVTCASSIKYTGKALNPVTAVKIGKNVLPESDYSIEYHIGTEDGTKVNNVLSKGSYVAVIKVKGNNLTTDKKTQLIKKFTVK